MVGSRSRVAAAGLAAADGSTGVLVGGRATVEDAYAYSKFARMVLGTNDIDFRARAHSAEEAEFLAAHVAGQPMTVTYADLENAPAVLLAGFEPEEESPIVFLRLRKAVRKNGLAGEVDRAVRHPRADQDARAARSRRRPAARPRHWTGWPTTRS